MKAPAFQFYVKDWLCSRRVLSMSGDAVKAYVYLLCEAWLQNPRATIPEDDKELASMARVSDAVWNDVKNSVLDHFKKGTCEQHLGRLYNEKQLELSRDYESKQRLNNKNAKRTQNERKMNAKRLSASASASASAIALKKRNTFTPPQFEEFKKYCIENGYGEIAERAFKYYDVAGWKDSNGDQVRSWKQKLLAVWFKPENKKRQMSTVGKPWC